MCKFFVDWRPQIKQIYQKYLLLHLPFHWCNFRDEYEHLYWAKLSILPLFIWLNQYHRAIQRYNFPIEIIGAVMKRSKRRLARPRDVGSTRTYCQTLTVSPSLANWKSSRLYQIGDANNSFQKEQKICCLNHNHLPIVLHLHLPLHMYNL